MPSSSKSTPTSAPPHRSASSARRISIQFTAARDGRYRIDTRGSTDVVMKLFGPNSETALIAEDDDSGVDTNALITRELVAGQYFVQVRHYNRASGKGKYSIKVQRL